MKKLLLSLMLICAFAMTKAQNVLLNEVYGNPGGTNSEFVELFNSAGAENLDCYTLLVYFENEGGTNQGWYVLDFPSTSSIGMVPGFFVLASQANFTTQGGPGTANLNWNDAGFRSSATGYLKKYLKTGGTNATATYTLDATFTTSTVVTNLLDGTLNGSQYYFTILYKNGKMVNGFVGGGASATLSSYNIPMGTLDITPAGACGATFNAFAPANLIATEFFNPSGGNDNGYARKFDGKCGSWVKTAPSVNHTPGAPNGNATSQAGSLLISQFINCNDFDPNTPGTQRAAVVDVTGVSGDLTESTDFPVKIRIYLDVNRDSIPDGPAFDSATHSLVADDTSTFLIPDNNAAYIVSYQTQRGCFDRQEPLENACAPLPVKFSMFTAARTRSNVGLVWETVSEENSKGFYVQRLIGSGSWETIGFVPSKAVNGNSTSLLHYEFSDYNPTKGITQYRLHQVDLDGKSGYSNVRAVRGEDQSGSTIVYPNPSNDGSVNIVFDNNNASRNVSVMDMNGRAIKQWRNVTNNIIRVENLTPGFYSVRIVNNDTGEQIVEKIIVNKR